MPNKTLDTAENRCRRCNRVLKDQSARYGWRCAEIMGVSDSLNTSGDGAFSAYMQGFKAAEKYLRDNNIDISRIDLIKYLTSYAKQYVALSMDDKELWRAAHEDMMDAINPPRDKDGKIIFTKGNSPSVEIYVNKKDNQDFDNGKFTTTQFIDKQFDLRTYELQKAFNKVGVTDKYGFGLKEDGLWGPKTQWAYNNFILDKTNRKKSAKDKLNEIIDRQYGLYKTIDISDIVTEANSSSEIIGNYVFLQNFIGKLADARMNRAFADINANIDNIKATANEFNIPEEVIASVILKEQYTKFLPDTIANITTPIGKKIPILEKYLRKIFGEHSTGSGAIFPDTARPAWERYLGKKKADDFLPIKDLELQYKLSSDSAFNVRSIGVVLADKAFQLDLINSYDDIKNIPYNEWERILTKYNGDETYGKYVYEYLPHMKEYLR